MIKCMIVGRNSANKFSEFIDTNSGGSADIVKSISSIFSEFENLNKEIIRVDKLVYFISESSNIMKDITSLDQLLSNPTYFRVKEFFIFGKDDQETKLGVDKLKFILNEHKINDVVVSLNQDNLTFSKMYTDLMGVEDKSEDSIKRKSVYLVEKSDRTSKRFYDALEYNENKVFQEKNSSDSYEEAKKASEVAETRNIIRDIPEKKLPKVNITLNTIDINKIANIKNIIVVTGKPKSGSSIFASSLVKSMIRDNKRVTLVDISANFGSAWNCTRSKSLKHRVINNKELFTGKIYDSDGVNILYPAKFSDSTLYPSYLKYILSIPNRLKGDILVIDCLYSDLDEIMDICGSRISKIFLCSQNVRNELLQVSKRIETLTNMSSINFYVYLNNSINFSADNVRLLPVQASSLFNKTKFLAPINFNEDVDLGILWKEEVNNG